MKDGTDYTTKAPASPSGWKIEYNTDPFLFTMHEVLHTFHCHKSSSQLIPNKVTGYIMSEGNLEDFNMHIDTHFTLLSNINQYDGP